LQTASFVTVTRNCTIYSCSSKQTSPNTVSKFPTFKANKWTTALFPAHRYALSNCSTRVSARTTCLRSRR